MNGKKDTPHRTFGAPRRDRDERRVQVGSRRDSLQGVWKPVETGAGPNTTPLVGLAIFTQTHYSVMYFGAAPERPDIVDVSTASADEMRVLWAGWAAHTGSYEVKR